MDSESTPPPAVNASVRPFKVLTGKELFNLPSDSTKWLVNGLLPAVGTSIVGAPPKAGKSVLSRQLCASVTMGQPFLGRDVEQGKTLYFATQDRAGLIVDHFRSLGCTADTFPAVIAGERFQPNEALARLKQTVTGISELRLIVLDMIGDLLPLKDSNDYVEMSRRFAPLHQFAEDHKLHICATHHTKKAQTENPVHSFIGSSAIPGAVDQLICLSTDSRQQRYITTAQRYGESLPLTVMNWDAERRAMFLGQTADEMRTEQKKATEDRIIQDLMVFIMGNPGRTREEILDAVKGDATTKRKAFNLLNEVGHIVQSGRGQKGDPFVYTISDSSEETAAEAA
jgi:RecA-family ATPase